MSMPAARMGDMTAHGGAIVMGFPTVLIGGMPAARLMDMHVCPMVTVIVPHVGGPILPPCSPTVLIGGLPAARMTDMAVCVGPPDVIVMGCPTVLIGMAGGGAAGGGGGAGAAAGGGAGGAGDAVMSAGIAMIAGGPGKDPSAGGGGGSQEEQPAADKQEGHWIEFQFVDKARNPISGVQYEFTAPDGDESEGTLRGSGKIRWSGPDAGQGTVKLMDVSNARWSQKDAKVGDTVKLMADVEGYESGTEAIFEVWERDNAGADRSMAKIDSQVDGSKVEAEWQYQYPEDAPHSDMQTQKTETWRYSSPEYYFIVRVKNSQARSGMLELRDWTEISLKDGDENVIYDAEYVLYLSDGSVRKGVLDKNGYKKEDNIPPKQCRLVFKDIYKMRRRS